MLLNSVCVSWCTSKKSRGPIYISLRPSFMSIYPRPVALLRAAPVVYAAQKLIIIIRSRKASCRCLFRSLLPRTPSLSSHNFIIRPFFPKITVLHGFAAVHFWPFPITRWFFFPPFKTNQKPFFLFSFKECTEPQGRGLRGGWRRHVTSSVPEGKECQCWLII